jgi:fructokinase
MGAGLISLDILINERESFRPESYYVGGTCGNVMMILSFMGWISYPVARLDANKYTQRILSDMIAHGVHTNFVLREDGKTPVIIQRNSVDEQGNPIHKFQFPNGARALNYTSYTLNQMRALLNNGLKEYPDIFFFDRISPANLLLAKTMREKGVIVFFEPSCSVNAHNFDKCIEVSDIIKFSNQRISDLHPFDHLDDKLIIQTLGEKGLMYRLNSEWRHLCPVTNDNVIDTSGAGDWTTAAIINGLKDRYTIADYTQPEIESILLSAQKLGSYSCSFEGARGMMSVGTCGV